MLNSLSIFSPLDHFLKLFSLTLFATLFVGCVSGTCAPSGEPSCGYPEQLKPVEVGDFSSCVSSGGSVNSFANPPSCRDGDGRVYVEIPLSR